jgi:hypothetical protein
MNPQLRKTVQDFLVDYDHIVSDLQSIADYDLWLTTAIDLLQLAVVDDYKIPEDYYWAGLKNGVIIELSRDSLSLHHDHIDEIIPIRLKQ